MIKFEQELETTDNGTSVPPKWGSEATHYFENDCGEQWIAKYDNGKVFISGMDIAWKEIILNNKEIKEHLQFRKNLITVTSKKKLFEIIKKYKESNNPLSKIIFGYEETLWIQSVLESFSIKLWSYEKKKNEKEKSLS